MLAWFTGLFWSRQFWLPQNVTWEDLESTTAAVFPKRSEFAYSLLIGVALLVVRILTESFVFLPIGHFFGWVKGPLLFGPEARIIQHLTGGFAGKSKFKRVAECAWRFSFYLCAWSSGLHILSQQPQFWDVQECWKGWPRHEIESDVWWYYMIETGFYWGLLYSTMFIDVRRKDFHEMMLHHAITILLLWTSWSMNMIRVGTMILFSHDVADVLLELGKLFRYANWNGILNVHFPIFMLTWIGSRLVYYPFWLLHSVINDAPAKIQADYRWKNWSQPPHAPRILLLMLCTLVVLHLLWTALLLKIAYYAITSTGVNDIREDSEDEDSKKNE